MDKDRARLIQNIVEKTGWGPVTDWQGGDFRRLGQLIFDKTHVNISESTLRRLLGRADYPHLPSETSLNTLAIFIGYDSWRDFKMQAGAEPPKTTIDWKFIIAGVAMIVLVLLITVAFNHFKTNPAAPGFNYQFSSRPLTRAIPNTVIFNYKVDKHAAPVYIQQSWDSRTRTKVAANENTYASVYYRPGFFQAKLLVGNKIVKEHPLIIPTDGWLGLIYREPVPVYLNSSEFTTQDKLEVLPEVFANHGVKLEPDLYRAELYNVGNFNPVDAGHFEFSAMIKSDYTSGTGVCGVVVAFLITNGVPISLPVCNRGCVATIGFYNGRGHVSGKTTDLSGFGAPVSSWVKIAVKTTTGKLQLLVNNQVAYECPLPPAGLKILGLAFGFEGGGAVKEVTLGDGKNTTFSAD